MDEKYATWIAANVKGDGYGQCAETTKAMADAFPELTRVRGHYFCWAWGEREHWWLTTSSNEIVDPTCKQFPSKGRGGYIPWDESRPQPTSICPNCSGHCFNDDYCCSESCERAYAAYCSNPNGH
jgi:hypothetical protein